MCSLDYIRDGWNRTFELNLLQDFYKPWDMFYSTYGESAVYCLKKALCHKSNIRNYSIVGTLCHDGCVNTLEWSLDGKYCITGSDDRTIKLWNLRGNLSNIPLEHTLHTPHLHNIFDAKFIPHSGNHRVVSGGGRWRLFCS